MRKLLRASATSKLGVLGAGSVALLLIAQRQSLSELWRSWQSEEYSHGPIIPLLAVFIACHLLAAKKPVLQPSWWGVPVLMFAALLQILGQLSAFTMAGEYAVAVGLVALCLMFLGVRATRVITPALFYLLFAIPLPHLMQANLSAQLQLLSSTLGVLPLQLFSIPVFQEGNIIDLGTYRLQVAEACNGLRYLFPLLSFGYLIALLVKDRIWKKILIILSTIPITLLLNSLRIAIIGITVDRWGRAMAEGVLHAFEGWLVFLACLAVLALVTRGLLRIPPRGTLHNEYLGLPNLRGYGWPQSARLTPVIVALLLSGILAAGSTGSWLEDRAEIHPVHLPLISFPQEIGDWRGRTSALTPDILQALQLSDYVLSDYSDGSARTVNFYVAYYASQRVGMTTHSPSNCIPGGGWQIANHDVRMIALTNGDSLRLTRLVIRRGNQAQLVYYWFDERGRNLAETTEAKLYLLRDSLLMQRSDGALVRLMTPLSAQESENDGDERLSGFLNLVVPELGRYVPGSGL